MFNKARLLLLVLPRLGVCNVADVAIYRLALAGGLIEKVMPAGNGYHLNVAWKWSNLLKNSI